ncbi:CBASS cGAMP-activated phospholipase [Afipia sp. TerB]|jgi:predicted acylesterase/phospholipase RssA|nr:patatin-like phospholipase family protein [Hyphomicrobiales bacterium]
MIDANSGRSSIPRSAGAIRERRKPQPWPKDQRFRILSIDGGGIKGLFPATILSELEQRYLGGDSIAGYFDLIVGTSTGGILALGLGAGLKASELAHLYICRGPEIFPEPTDSTIDRIRAWWSGKRHFLYRRYEREPLEKMLRDILGKKTFGESIVRLCIPAFEGRHSEVFVFKTPHHPDYKCDRFDSMVKVALSASAAPTFFRPLEHNHYTLIDGGVWANNPAMLAVIEAMICFDIDRSQIDLFSIGCGDDPYVVSGDKIDFGGKFAWSDIIFAAMRLQSLSAINQARLLLGPPSVHRIDPPKNPRPILLDDYRRSIDELVPAAKSVVDEFGQDIAYTFLARKASAYEPVPISESST